jgi:hypothetical protein
MMDVKPKTLLYAEALAAVEQRIVDALPDIVDGLIARAKGGDAKVAVYLCDRIMGRAAGSGMAPAHDRTFPYSEDDYLNDQRERESKMEINRLLAGFGARNGA